MIDFPIFTYYITIEYIQTKIKLKKIDIIHNPQTIGFSNKEITIELIEKNLKDILNKLSNSFYELINQDYIIFSHPFRGKDNKIYHFKEMLKLIEQNKNLYKFKGIAINISDEKEYEFILKSIKNSPHIGYLIYKENIIETNEYIKKILDIDNQIYNLSPLDIFPNKIKEKIKPIIKKRLKGEFFSSSYLFEIPSFKNRRRYIEFFANTIIYKREYAGFVIGIDKTTFYKQQKLLEISYNVNKVLSLNIFDIDELISKIISAIKENNFFTEVEFNKKLNYPSSLSLEIKENNTLIGKIYLYSKYNEDFDEQSKKILKNLEKEINRKINSINLYITQILLQSAVNKGFEWILITDENGKIIYVNDSVEKISLYKKEEILNKKPNIFKSNIHDTQFYKNLWNTITKGNIFEEIIINKNKNGELFYLKEKIIPVTLPNGKQYYVALGIDITKEKELENKLINIAFKDKLTTLLNREGFIIYSSEKIIRENSNYALLLIDIKDFHFINEILGHQKANEILKQFGQFLQNIFNKSIISRLGDDEFAILINFKNIKEIEKQILKLIEFLKKIKFQNTKLDINIGIAIFPKDANNIEILIQKASTALERAKEKGENTYEFFNNNISTEIKNYISIKNLLNKAIKNNEFTYFFQPYVNSKTFEIIGAESLLRIKDKDKIIPPSLFIDYAEKSGLIKTIEQIGIKKLINCIKDLKIKISFNISAKSLEDKNHINYIINITKNYSKLLNIEITERELINEIEKIKNIFELLKSNNFEISIDDFGTGYSSLNYIKHIPIDYIKIDMDFIHNITNSNKDRAIVDTIINFAKRLNLKTIAEGIETEEQVKILQELGCDYFQGFYFYKPMPIEELKKKIKNN